LFFKRAYLAGKEGRANWRRTLVLIKEKGKYGKETGSTTKTTRSMK